MRLVAASRRSIPRPPPPLALRCRRSATRPSGPISTEPPYAFRYSQRKQPDAVLALRRLAVSAFPESADAAYPLGVAAADAGQSSESREALARALALLEASPMMSEQKERMRQEIRNRTGGRL